MLLKNIKVWSEVLRNAHGRSGSWLASIASLLNPSLPSTSTDSLRHPLPRGPLTLKNRYVPLSRSFVVRELLQDDTVLLPSERNDFERMISSMQRRLNAQYTILERELAVLFQPVVSSESPNDLEQLVKFASSQNDAESLRHLFSVEHKDREFWILRRIDQLAKFAGFLSVPKKDLENAFRARRLNRESASSFIDPRDYNVIRFWVRGIHPCTMENLPGVAQVSPDQSRSSVLQRIGNLISNPRSEFTSILRQLQKQKWHKAVLNATDRSMKLGDAPSARDFQFTNVLMAVRSLGDGKLWLKFFDSVPASRPSRRTNYTDSLSLLLPIIHFQPMTPIGRTWIALSCLTAVTCLGFVTPMAWLLCSNPESVFAWSAAASTTAGLTASLIWAQYWRSRAKANAYLKQLQFSCTRNSGFQSVQSLLRIAIDEEFKSLILTYALLLRPTEGKSPLNLIALGIRAESWICKRLSPKAYKPSGQTSSFGGGHGPLFDLEFDPTRPLELLRRLGLVHGPKDNPRAISVSTAANLLGDLDSGDGSSRDLSSLWILDPAFGNEFRTNMIE